MAKVSFDLLMSEYKRMCSSYDDCEEGCPLFGEFLEGTKLCAELFVEKPKVVEQVVLNWRKENPQDTNFLLFIKKFKAKPWAEKNENNLCRCGYAECNEEIPCNDCPWWREPVSPTDDEKIYELPRYVESSESDSNGVYEESDTNTQTEDESEPEGELEGQISIDDISEVLEESEEQEEIEEDETKGNENDYVSDEDLEGWGIDDLNEESEEKPQRVERKNYNPDLKNRAENRNYQGNNRNYKKWDRR